MKKTYIVGFTKKELKILTKLIVNELSQDVESWYHITMIELVDTDNKALKKQYKYASLLSNINKKISKLITN